MQLRGEIAEKAVAKDAGDARVAGVEDSPHTALCELGQVLSVVAPPGAVVIPEVVERQASQRAALSVS